MCECSHGSGRPPSAKGLMVAIVGVALLATAAKSPGGGVALANIFGPLPRLELPNLTPGSPPAADPGPAVGGIPTRYRTLYQQAGRDYGVPWQVLAGIGKVESSHGQSRAPGVHSGVNRFGCCAGPMQFNLRNGPPSTWDAYGNGSPYQPEDAIPAAARLLVANGAHRNLDRAIYGYNHSWSYVATVKAWAKRYGWRG